MDVDWFAVHCAVTGTRMPNLTNAEKEMVARRLHGRMTAEKIGHQIGVGLRGVQHIVQSFDPADLSDCPVCHEPMWVLRAGRIVEAHHEGFFQDCPLSGRCLDDYGDWSSRQAMLALLLARRIRTGGSVPVWAEIRGLSENQRLELLMVALAGIDCDTDPFSWLDAQDEVERTA